MRALAAASCALRWRKHNTLRTITRYKRYKLDLVVIVALRFSVEHARRQQFVCRGFLLFAFSPSVMRGENQFNHPSMGFRPGK